MPTLLEVRLAKPSARQLQEARADLDHCALIEVRPAKLSAGRLLEEARADLDHCALMGPTGGDDSGQSVGFDRTASGHAVHPSKTSRRHGPVL